MQEPEPLPRIPKVTFDYRSGRFENVTPELVQRWTEAYPAIDVGVEIAKAGEWAAANPKNRKANWQRFLINWFARAQEKARASPQTGSGKWGRLELS